MLHARTVLLLITLVVVIMSGCAVQGPEDNRRSNTSVSSGPPPIPYADRSITFTLTAPTQYMNNDPILSGEITGFHIYTGIAPGAYSGSPLALPATAPGIVSTVTVTISVATGRTNYFSVTAYDEDGVESDYATEISKMII